MSCYTVIKLVQQQVSSCSSSSQTEEENAALLAALTDSLDGMVDAEVGGLSVFPALEEEEPVQEDEDEEDEEEDGLPLGPGDLSQVLGAESEDPSLVRTRENVLRGPFHERCQPQQIQ